MPSETEAKEQIKEINNLITAAFDKALLLKGYPHLLNTLSYELEQSGTFQDSSQALFTLADSLESTLEMVLELISLAQDLSLQLVCRPHTNDEEPSE